MGEIIFRGSIMKLKIGLALGALFCSFVIWQLNTGVDLRKMTYIHTTLPGGAYASTCRNITIKTVGSGDNVSRLITADCEDIDHNLKRSSINLPIITNDYLDFTLENQNGTLKSFQPQLLQ